MHLKRKLLTILYADDRSFSFRIERISETKNLTADIIRHEKQWFDHNELCSGPVGDIL